MSATSTFNDQSYVVQGAALLSQVDTKNSQAEQEGSTADPAYNTFSEVGPGSKLNC